jgi:hypothetical protein
VTDVPRTLDDLTPAWLSDALGAEVAGVHVTPIAEGEGFMGRLGRVALTYADPSAAAERPASVVAKLPTDEPGSVALGQMLRIWEREAKFYRDLAPKLPVRTPHCWYADGDHDSGIYALLLEDLSPYTCGDQVVGATPEQAAAAVEWLARFHAAESGGGHSAGMDWVPATATDPMYQALGPMIEAVFPVFHDKFGAMLPEGTAGWVERMVPRWGESIAEQLLPPTLVHADFRVDNLFFDDRSGAGGGLEVIALDWQALALGEGLYDLAYFLGGSVEVEQRRATERSLVASYGRTMRELGVDVPGEDDLFDHYRKAFLLVMTVSALLMGQLDLTVNQRAVDLANVVVHRFYTAAADLSVGDLIPD